MPKSKKSLVQIVLEQLVIMFVESSTHMVPITSTPFAGLYRLYPLCLSIYLRFITSVSSNLYIFHDEVITGSARGFKPKVKQPIVFYRRTDE